MKTISYKLFYSGQFVSRNLREVFEEKMMSASAFFSWRIILQTFIYSFVVAAVAIILNFEIQQQLWIYLTETSCLLKNNYILMEVSRPISKYLANLNV